MRDDGYFDETVAVRYDASAARMFEPEVVDPAVDFLAGFGLGWTGARARDRDGSDRASAGAPGRSGPRDRNVARDGGETARKPGGEDIGVTVGDFATAKVDGSFSVAYLVFNTIMNLTTQAAQVACFRNVASHLQPGGCFVVEVVLPELRRLPPGTTVITSEVGETPWSFDEYEVATQGLTSHHFEVVDGTLERFSVPFRYVWPSELDLVAELAGMRLRERWSGWQREEYTSESGGHVSVWEKADDLPLGGRQVGTDQHAGVARDRGDQFERA